MFALVRGATVNSVWRETFKGRDGEDVEFYRALVTVVDEAPSQLGVRREDYETMSACIGVSGDLYIDVDARPGQRVRVYAKGIEQ